MLEFSAEKAKNQMHDIDESILHEKINDFCDKMEDKLESKINNVFVELEKVKL